MSKAALVALPLVLMLAVAGCAKDDMGAKNAGIQKKGKAAVESTQSPNPPAESKNTGAPAEKGASKEAPNLVIRTDNQVSNQEAGALLDEVDRQLNDLINTLDRLDDVDDKDLEY